MKRHKIPNSRILAARAAKAAERERRLAEIERLESELWASYERGDITYDVLQFELDGLILSN